MKPTFDASKLNAMLNASQGQVAVHGVQRSIDPKFPMFQIPVDTDVIVYFPRTNLIQTENGEDMQVVSSVLHNVLNGKFYSKVRCIKGLDADVFKDFGYDGSCPICDAQAECWDLAQLKIEKRAKEMGRNPDDDAEDMKNMRSTIRGEMAIKSTDNFVTLPIVVIPKAEKRAAPAENALEDMKAYFVTWSKKVYTDMVLSALETLEENPGHPAGLFFVGKYTYDTKGKKPNARDAAREAQYLLLQNQKSCKGLIEKAEELAKDFTLVKAIEVLTEEQFMPMEDIQKMVNRTMKDTRRLLAVLNKEEGQETQAPAIAPAGSAEALLGAFGKADASGDLGVPQSAGAEADAGADAGIVDLS